MNNTGNRKRIMECELCSNKELCYHTFNVDVSKNGIDIPNSCDVKA